MIAAIAWQPHLAIVDSTGELLPSLRLSSNSPDDFTIAHNRVLKPLAREVSQGGQPSGSAAASRKVY